MRVFPQISASIIYYTTFWGVKNTWLFFKFACQNYKWRWVYFPIFKQTCMSFSFFFFLHVCLFLWIIFSCLEKSISSSSLYLFSSFCSYVSVSLLSKNSWKLAFFYLSYMLQILFFWAFCFSILFMVTFHLEIFSFYSQMYSSSGFCLMLRKPSLTLRL